MNLHVFKPALVNSQSDYKNWLSRTVDENKACTHHSDNLIELCELVVSILLLWVHRCSINNFKAIRLHMNTSTNNPVTTDDINIAEKIFGPNIGALREITCRKPTQVVNSQRSW